VVLLRALSGYGFEGYLPVLFISETFFKSAEDLLSCEWFDSVGFFRFFMSVICLRRFLLSLLVIMEL
jgi:hypothetical protein